MKRHRFKGLMGKTCTEPVPGLMGKTCGLNYSASLHYNDDDHPYEDPDRIGRCAWEMQNVVGAAPGGMFCLRESDDPVHQHDTSPEVTVVMQVPVAEPHKDSFDGFATGEHPYVQAGTPWAEELAAKEQKPVLDAPAEDGGSEGSWAYEPYDPVAPSAHDIGFPVGRPGTAARARWDLENGQVMLSGPWPVRQWYWGSPELNAPALEVVQSLASVGEAFVMETWWADHRTQLVRVQWGSLLLVSVAELYAAVESWPTA